MNGEQQGEEGEECKGLAHEQTLFGFPLVPSKEAPPMDLAVGEWNPLDYYLRVGVVMGENGKWVRLGDILNE